MTIQPTLTKVCENCGNTFTKSVTTPKSDWNKRRGCSPKCAAKLRGCAWLEKYKLQPGSQLGKQTQFKSDTTIGDKNINWKGEHAGYGSKHDWIRRHFGKANHCENCLTRDRKMFHWSNISGEYLRDRDDWQQLCVPCHKKYDLTRV